MYNICIGYEKENRKWSSTAHSIVRIKRHAHGTNGNLSGPSIQERKEGKTMEFNFSNYVLHSKPNESGSCMMYSATVDTYTNPQNACPRYVKSFRAICHSYARNCSPSEGEKAWIYQQLDRGLADSICKNIASESCLPLSILYEVTEDIQGKRGVASIADRIAQGIMSERRRAGFIAGAYPPDWGEHAEDPERED